MNSKLTKPETTYCDLFSNSRYKRLFSIVVFVTLTLTLIQFAAADYTLTNGSATESAWVTYSVWQPAGRDASGNWWPEGWRTIGWFEFKPGETNELPVPADRDFVYIRVERSDGEIKPPDHATRDTFLFWIHPSEAFTVVETNAGDFLKSDHLPWNLEQTEFYEYRNGGSYTITNNVSGQQNSLARQVFNKYSQTLQRQDIHAILPSVLQGLKDPNTQLRLNPVTINLVVNNPDLLPQFVPNIDPKFVTLLKRDSPLKAMLKDPLMQTLLQDPVAIDELAGFLNISEPVAEVGFQPNRPDLPAQDIHDQAMHSVVWIRTEDRTGSGVLIDEVRKLVVTNQHVTDGEEWVNVVFPYRDEEGRLIRDDSFYFGDDNIDWFMDNGYVTDGRVIAQNVRNDLAIVQLAQLPPGANEIKHDFSRNVENSMRDGDKVHILGNPGTLLWNWTQGTFLQSAQECLPSRGDCLVMEADVHSGNSGGPVLNGQGTLIGIVAAADDETSAVAVPTRSVKALLNSVPAHLPPVPPQQIYPKRTFKIKNLTGVPVHYQIKWSNNDNWQSHSLETGFIRTHQSSGQNIPQGYPQIRFDHIAGDGQQITYLSYNLESALENATVAPVYRFAFNEWGNRLDLYRDGFAAPSLPTVTPKETTLLSNYPNPFNPETWIPYHLAKPAEVTVAIYAADGKLVRTLALGHQPAGIYQSKSRAAYWDGKNELGETVASGLYFYTLKAGDFTATRKMLIRK